MALECVFCSRRALAADSVASLLVDAGEGSALGHSDDDAGVPKTGENGVVVMLATSAQAGVPAWLGEEISREEGSGEGTGSLMKEDGAAPVNPPVGTPAQESGAGVAVEPSDRLPVRMESEAAARGAKSKGPTSERGIFLLISLAALLPTLKETAGNRSA